MNTPTLLSILRMPQTSLNALITNGLVEPLERGGPGNGVGHQWSLAQAVGLLVARQIVGNGRHPQLLGALYDGVRDLSDDELLDAIANGRRFLFPGKGLLALRDPENAPPEIDIGRALDVVLERLEELGQAPAPVANRSRAE